MLVFHTVSITLQGWVFLSNGYLCTNLASESTQQKMSIYGEYSHSLKLPFSDICEIHQTCRHLPSGLASTCQARQHSPSTFAWTRQTHPHSPSTFAKTRQTRRHWPKAIFEKNMTRQAKFAPVMSKSGECGASGHCLVFTGLT
jgi:hypothetical protein